MTAELFVIVHFDCYTETEFWEYRCDSLLRLIKPQWSTVGAGAEPSELFTLASRHVYDDGAAVFYSFLVATEVAAKGIKCIPVGRLCDKWELMSLLKCDIKGADFCI